MFSSRSRSLLQVLSFIGVAALGCTPDASFLAPDPDLPGIPGPTLPPPPPPSPPADPPVTPLPPAPTGIESVAYGRWTPGEHDTCSKEIHDSYRVVGPDGKWYPTWHPPVDPATGCTFGHEHGRDPAGSDLYGTIEPLAFGYANEQLMDAGGPTGLRHEDHVGHKVEWLNDAQVMLGSESISCDILVKLHQGTHSKDAFANNVHELFYHVGCSNGLIANVRILSPIGPSGEFTESCDLANRVPAGSPTPFDSPHGEGDSRRRIPALECAVAGALTEQWSTFTTVATNEGRLLADFNPYVRILNPSRVFEAGAPSNMARPLEICRTGGISPALAQECAGVGADVAWDDPRSPFRGDNHSVSFNRLTMPGNPIDVWYTDAYGKHGSPIPFAHSIRQVLHGSTAAGYQGRITYFGARTGDFHAPGVHAPN